MTTRPPDPGALVDPMSSLSGRTVPNRDGGWVAEVGAICGWTPFVPLEEQLDRAP